MLFNDILLMHVFILWIFRYTHYLVYTQYSIFSILWLLKHIIYFYLLHNIYTIYILSLFYVEYYHKTKIIRQKQIEIDSFTTLLTLLQISDLFSHGKISIRSYKSNVYASPSLKWLYLVYIIISLLWEIVIYSDSNGTFFPNCIGNN